MAGLTNLGIAHTSERSGLSSANCAFGANYNSSTASARKFCTMCSWRLGVLLPM